MTRILITGGLGLIGSEIAEQAIAHGHHVTIVDDGRARVVPFVEGARHVEQSIQSYGGTDPMDVVIHAAAPVGPVGILGVDVLVEMFYSTLAACELARRLSCRLVVFSSSEVYGTTEPTSSLTVPDDWSHRTEYGVGKIVTEQIARRHHAETTLPTAIIRPWNVTGPRQAGSKGFVFPRMAAQAIAGEPITVYAPGDQRRAFMDVGDLAVQVLALVGGQGAWDATPMDAANPDNEVSMTDLAAMFAHHPLSRSREVVVVDPTIEHGPSFREAAAGSKLPTASVAMRGALGIRPMVDLALLAANAPALSAAA